MKKVTIIKEKIRLEARLFKKPLYTLLISVAVGLSPSISLSQENLNARKTIENSQENKFEKQASKIPEKSITANEEKLNAIREILISEALKTKAGKSKLLDTYRW